METNALYYPWIDPPNREILATSILYWDNLYTIVPLGMQFPYENRWSRNAHDLGFLKPRYVDSHSPEVEKVGFEFSRDLDRKAIQAEVADLGKPRSRRQNSGLRLHEMKVSASLHPAKMSKALREKLWASCQPDQEGYLRMSPGYAAAYMSRLASAVAEQDDAVPYTERRLSRDVLLDAYVDQGGDVIGENEVTLASLSIGTIRIRSGTSMTELISFRDMHYDELKRYRKAIRTLARQASAVRDPHSLDREIKRMVQEDLKPAQEVVEARLSDARCDFGISALQVMFATAVGFAASGVQGYAGAFGGATVGLGFQIGRWRLARERAKRDPLTYLANLRTRFHQPDAEE